VVNETGGTLAEALAKDPEVSGHFDRAAIDAMTAPANYLGLSAEMVDKVVGSRAR
jgi:3-carboxy-cis,cis-muconate cycloisomerase